MSVSPSHTQSPQWPNATPTGLTQSVNDATTGQRTKYRRSSLSAGLTCLHSAPSSPNTRKVLGSYHSGVSSKSSAGGRRPNRGRLAIRLSCSSTLHGAPPPGRLEENMRKESIAYGPVNGKCAIGEDFWVLVYSLEDWVCVGDKVPGGYGGD